MNGRQYLKNSITLYGESSDSRFERTFRIVRVISEGADGVCYEAYHEKSGKGVLKEFYPLGVVGTERNEKGQLGHTAEFGYSLELFRKTRERFLKPYEMLLEIKQNSADDDIASFIPSFELYYGSRDEDFDCSVYVWTPEPKLVTFDKICDEIHRKPGDRPEHKLVSVLNAVETLTKCICSLHFEDIIHRDIKPSNFGFRTRRGEILTQAISMFDIDSLCSLWDNSTEYTGTIGYMEPEARYSECSNQTDIYSIGATLFSAIIVTDEMRERGFLYSDDLYGRIKELVDSSELIQASEANSQPRLRAILTSILRKSLCGRRSRYRNCEALLEDIKEALFYALPHKIAEKSRSGQAWVLSDAEKKLDIHAGKNSFLQILYHLYEVPLYRNLGDDETELNIAVFGLDSYSQKFLDACLQTGQMRNVRLNVTVFYNDAADRRIYLSERPALSEYFVINGAYCEDAYGSIDFASYDYTSEGAQALSEELMERLSDRRIHYMFISLGNDTKNRRLADALYRSVRSRNYDCSVSYVSEDREYAVSGRSRIYPVYVNSSSGKSGHHREIERMAFNTHLVWAKNTDADLREIRKEFRKTYNHDSCVSGVVSMKYRLHGLGIETDELTPDEAAARYLEVLNDNGAVEDELIWTEHRRWVTEKICLGWTQNTDIERCVTEGTKDARNKKHICIIKSRPDHMLRDMSEGRDEYEIWNGLSEEEMLSLDGLDRLSVRLHRVYVEKAAEIVRSDIRTNGFLMSIESCIENDRGLLHSYKEWHRCIEKLWKGDRSAAPLYAGLKSAFTDAADEAPGLGSDQRHNILQQTASFDRWFRPVPASMMCRNWKEEDTALISSIPFILTDPDKLCLVIPYVQGSRAEQKFRNVSAAALADPARIIYLFRADTERELDALLSDAGDIVEFLGRKSSAAGIEFIIIQGNAAAGRGFADDLIKAGNGRIRKVLLADTDEAGPWAVKLREHLKKQKRSFSLALERNSSGLSDELSELGFYDNNPWYEFDSRAIEFSAVKGCEYLKYIDKRPYITVQDILCLSGDVSLEAEQTEFYDDHDLLWSRYCEQPEVWEDLCRELGAHAALQDEAACFRKSGSREADAAYRYVIPGRCSRGAEKVLGELADCGVTGRGSRISGYSPDSCTISIIDRYGNRGEFDRIFSNVYALMDPDSLYTELSPDGGLCRIMFNDMIVRDAEIRVTGEKRELLQFLAGNGYLTALRITDEGVSFTYASGQIKKMLTRPSEIKAVHIFRSIKSSADYDDAETGTLSLTADPERRTRCCIMTRGFTSRVILLGTADSAPEGREDVADLIADLISVNGEVLTEDGYLKANA